MKLGEQITWQEALRTQDPVFFHYGFHHYLMVGEKRTILTYPEMIEQADQEHTHQIVARNAHGPDQLHFVRLVQFTLEE